MSIELALLEDEKDFSVICLTDIGGYSALEELEKIMAPYEERFPLFFTKVLYLSIYRDQISVKHLPALRSEIRKMAKIKFDSIWERDFVDRVVGKIEQLVNRALKYNLPIVSV